jgi:hypothetical protein
MIMRLHNRGHRRGAPVGVGQREDWGPVNAASAIETPTGATARDSERVRSGELSRCRQRKGAAGLRTRGKPRGR